MSQFNWIFCGRLAYSDKLRRSVEEYYGWWYRLPFGIFVYIKKARAGWCH